VKLPPEDIQFLVQFIENCESAGVRWRIGQQGDARYVVTVLVGAAVVTGKPQPKLHQAIKACVETAAVMGAAESLKKGVNG
jgi:hypothetical protein